MAAGTAPLIAVCAGGFSLGFFLWYALAMRSPSPGVSELGFLALLPAGIVIALAAWQWYGRYFARRAGVSLDTALAYDSLSWVALTLLWFTFTLWVGPSTTGRATFVAAALFCLVKLVVAARFNATVRDVSLTFILTRIPILIIAELAAVVIGQRAGQHVQVASNPALSVWGRWDAVHYLDIAQIGYYGTDMAFFPLYPILVKLLGRLLGNYLVAGLVISNVALFFGLLFFYKLVAHEWGRSVAHRAIFYISIFPTAVFFSAVYTESLFFALTVTSFYYIREHRWLTAGIIGFFAAMTRVEGVLLAVPFVLEWFFSEDRRLMLEAPVRRFVRPLIGIVLIPLGLAAYMAFLWVLRGDPLYFSHVQEHWNRHLAAPWVSLIHAVHLITATKSAQTVANQSIELAFTLLMLGVLVVAIRRLSPAYWSYMLLSILVPMSTSSLMSMQRFALVLFPMFVIFALWGSQPNRNNAIVAFSLPLLGLFTVLFADWYWVG